MQEKHRWARAAVDAVDGDVGLDRDVEGSKIVKHDCGEFLFFFFFFFSLNVTVWLDTALFNVLYWGSYMVDTETAESSPSVLPDLVILFTPPC